MFLSLLRKDKKNILQKYNERISPITGSFGTQSNLSFRLKLNLEKIKPW